MKKLKYSAWILCGALGLAAQGPSAGQPLEAEQPEVELLSPAQRLANLAREVRGADWERAIQGGEALLQEPALLDERQRSQVHFATGLARALQAIDAPLPAAQPAPLVQAGQPAAPGAAAATPVLGAGFLAASRDFESSRALAGPGELRLSATYDLGTSALLRAELWRMQIPEVAQAAGQQPMALPGQPSSPGMPSMPGAPGTAGAGDEPAPPDPLAEARSAYLEAKQCLILRLRSDWTDADTRANLELIQRRLRELDEIEEQREEEQQESEDQDQDSEDQQEGEDGEEGEEGEDGEQEEGEDGEPSEDGEQGEDQEQQEQEGDQEGEQEGEPEEEPGDEQEQEQPDSAPEDSEAQGGEAQSSKQEPAERVLTREEVIRLLDKLAELEAEAEQMKAAKAKSETVRVDRDW